MILKDLFLKLKKWDDKTQGTMLNYPSKGIAPTILSMVIWSATCTFAFSAMFFDHWRGDTLSKISFILMFSIASLLFAYCVYRYTYKPIKHYENRYGKTGLGDKYIKKWEDIHE